MLGEGVVGADVTVDNAHHCNAGADAVLCFSHQREMPWKQEEAAGHEQQQHQMMVVVEVVLMMVHVVFLVLPLGSFLQCLSEEICIRMMSVWRISGERPIRLFEKV